MLWHRDVGNAGNMGERAPTLPGGVREGITWEVTVELCLEGREDGNSMCEGMRSQK